MIPNQDLFKVILDGQKHILVHKCKFLVSYEWNLYVLHIKVIHNNSLAFKYRCSS